MNIFVLDTNPAIAASYHCDQHLHKMILESAQMLSTVARHYATNFDSGAYSGYYKPTHSNHPCTIWLRENINNCAWLVELCNALNSERLSAANCDDHASMRIVELFTEDFLFSPAIGNCIPAVTGFTFAGPLQIAVSPDLNVIQKYRKYYRLKNQQWIRDGKGPMTWKNRTEPEWMTNWPAEDN